MTSLPSPSQQAVPGVCTGSLPGVACWPRTGNRREVSDGPSTPTGSAWPHPSILTTLACTVLQASDLSARGAGRLPPPQAAVRAFDAVAGRVFVVYASCGLAAEPKVIGVASSAMPSRKDRYGWRRPTWLEWGSARRVHSGVDERGDAVEVWLVQIGLDELPRLALASEPLIEEHQRPHAGRYPADVGDRGYGRIGDVSNPAGQHRGAAERQWHGYRRGAAGASMRRMSTKPGTRDGAVPPKAATDSDGNADTSPPAFPEQIYQQAMARLAAIIDEWQKARGALLRG